MCRPVAIWRVGVSVGAGMLRLPRRCWSQLHAGPQGVKLDGARGHLCSCFQGLFLSSSPSHPSRVCLPWEVAQAGSRVLHGAGVGTA